MTKLSEEVRTELKEILLNMRDEIHEETDGADCG